MPSQDTIDFGYLHTVSTNDQFMERCWVRFLVAAFGVAGEAVRAPVTAITAAGAATLTFSATPASITGLFVTDLTSRVVIPVGTKIASVTATTAVMDRNAINDGVAEGDSISFAPAFHDERVRFAGALFSNTVSLLLLSNTVLAGATNRANCLADRSIPGGNITDAGIDAQITLTYTGLATSKTW